MIGTKIDNDSSLRLIPHPLMSKSGQLVRRIQIDLYRLPPSRDTIIVIFRGKPSDTLGTIDKNVKLSTPYLIDNPHHLKNITGFGKVTLDDSITRSPGFDDVLIGLFGTVEFGVVVDEDGCSSAGEFFSDGGSDSAGGAGDEGSFACEGVGGCCVVGVEDEVDDG